MPRLSEGQLVEPALAQRDGVSVELLSVVDPLLVAPPCHDNPPASDPTQ